MKKVIFVIVSIIVLYYVYERATRDGYFLNDESALTYHERQVYEASRMHLSETATTTTTTTTQQEQEQAQQPVNKTNTTNTSGECYVVGHDEILADIRDVFGLWELPDTERVGLYEPPKGVLLYGPPGTGKTTLVKQLCKEQRVSTTCLRITPDMIENKYQGESFKLLRAVFTVAKKMQPCLIFFDEIDGIMAGRNDLDQSHTNTMKTMFLNGMDEIGLSKVLVVGATNRPESLDVALMRRMELKFEMGFPSKDVKECFMDTFDVETETKTFVCERFQSLNDMKVFLKYITRSKNKDLEAAYTKFKLNFNL
jgi:AAA+ superfamily predicted ATPase